MFRCKNFLLFFNLLYFCCMKILSFLLLSPFLLEIFIILHSFNASEIFFFHFCKFSFKVLLCHFWCLKFICSGSHFYKKMILHYQQLKCLLYKVSSPADLSLSFSCFLPTHTHIWKRENNFQSEMMDIRWNYAPFEDF